MKLEVQSRLQFSITHPKTDPDGESSPKSDTGEKKEEVRSQLSNSTRGGMADGANGSIPSEMQQFFLKFDEEDLKLKLENALAYVNNEVKTLKSSLMRTKEEIARARKK